MLQLQIYGSYSCIQAFLYDLQQRPHIEVIEHENKGESLEPVDPVSMTLYVRMLPNRRVRMVEIMCQNGQKIHIPMMDAIQVKMDEGVTVLAGRVFDPYG